MLKLPNSKLGVIESTCRGIPDDCLREMIDQWLVQVDPQPTKTALVKAVKHYNPALAQKIAAL